MLKHKEHWSKRRRESPPSLAFLLPHLSLTFWYLGSCEEWAQARGK